MKKIFLFLIFTITVKFAFVQNAFPILSDNPTWHVLEPYVPCPISVTYQYKCDTSLCGFNYLIVTQAPGNINVSNVGFVRVDSEKVFLRKNTNCLGKEYLLYDFSLEIGDSIYCGYPTLDTTLFWVTDINTVNYFGVNRKTFKMNYFLSTPGLQVDSMNWIEGIGSDKHPFYSIVLPYIALLCYDSSSTLLYRAPGFWSCDTIFAEINNKDENQINVLLYPNPFQETMHIELELKDKTQVMIEIYSSTGQKLKTIMYKNQEQGKITYKIGNDLKKGMYFLKLSFNNNEFYKKIIKID